MSIIPDYNITGQQVTPQEILDVIPEQEASDRAIQASEERYLQGLEKNAADRVRREPAEVYKDISVGLRKYANKLRIKRLSFWL